MLPQLGERLARGSARAAAPFMSAYIALTQLTIMLSAEFIGRFANALGRTRILVFGFAVLPIRAVLYSLLHNVPALLAVQVLDGAANAIFGVVSIPVIADRTRGSGRFNSGQGALACGRTRRSTQQPSRWVVDCHRRASGLVFDFGWRYVCGRFALALRLQRTNSSTDCGIKGVSKEDRCTTVSANVSDR